MESPLQTTDTILILCTLMWENFFVAAQIYNQ